MKKYFILSFFLLASHLTSLELLDPNDTEKHIVKSTKRIFLPECPGATNPSLVEFQDHYLLTFRWTAKHWDEPWISFIGIVMFDKSLNQISKPEILDTRSFNHSTPSQSEDARIISLNEKLYVVYNDNMKVIFPNSWERRDMYLTELIYHEGNFFLGEPLRLRHSTKYRERPWQKNWSPFVWNGKLLFSYELNPHEVIYPDLNTGICQPFHLTQKSFDWDYGSLRGGTPAILHEGEYLAFFHSGDIKRTTASEYHDLWHYYMGAYTYSAKPPFALTKISKQPLNAPEFYTFSYYSKRIIYPGGFVIDGSNLYLAYGKDDCEIWIATIDINELKNSLTPVK